jgi:general stress protein CsbA
MKILLGILALILIAASVYADYKWRQWMAARRRDRQ